MNRKRWEEQYRRYIEVLPGSMDEFCFSGGTALSLAYLEHRISEDLDFIFLDESSDSEIILASISSAVKGNYRHEETLRNRGGERFGERWYLIDGESEIKIDVVRNRLVERLEVKNYKGVPILSLDNLYESKIKLLALQNQEDQFGLGKGRSRNIRDWIDVYELSRSKKRFSGFLLNEMDVDEQFIVNIDEGLETISGDHLQEELSYLQYYRSITHEELTEHFRQNLDTWYGHQFPV